MSANANSSRILRKNELDRAIYNTETYSLSLTQYLYNKPAWERYQKSKSLKAQKGYEAEDTLAEATVDLAKRYFVALAADDELALVQAERRATQKTWTASVACSTGKWPRSPTSWICRRE